MGALVKQKNPGWVASVLGNRTSLAGKEIACGYPSGKCSAYPETGEGVASIAAKNVFGIGQPQRDFMSYAQLGIIESTQPVMAAIAQQSSVGGDCSKLMEAAGAAGASAIKSAIVDGMYAPNSPATIAKKGAGKKPLIDTSHMLVQTTYTVREK